MLLIIFYSFWNIYWLLLVNSYIRLDAWQIGDYLVFFSLLSYFQIIFIQLLTSDIYIYF